VYHNHIRVQSREDVIETELTLVDAFSSLTEYAPEDDVKENQPHDTNLEQ